MSDEKQQGLDSTESLIESLHASRKKRSLLINPDYLDPYLNLGIIYMNKGHFDKAEKLFKNAIKRKEEYSLPYNYLGSVYLSTDRFNEAIHCFKQAINKDNNFFVKANALLQDLIVNILVNAIMHNENEIIEVQIKTSKYNLNQTHYIKLEFIDNGIGIPDDRKIDIFITREEEENKFRTGLGLSLIKKTVESYKGKIWVEDKVKGD